MKKLLFILVCFSISVISTPISGYSNSYNIISIDNNNLCTANDVGVGNNGFVAWIGENGGQCEVFLYDGVSSLPITQSEAQEYELRINDVGHAVWVASDEVDGDLEVFFFDGTTVHQITNNEYIDDMPDLNNNDRIVWAADDYSGTYCLYSNGGSGFPLPVCDDSNWFQVPRINTWGDVAWERVGVWWHQTDIILNGEMIAEQVGVGVGFLAGINDNGYVLWSQGSEIFLYQGNSTVQIGNGYWDHSPAMNNNGHVTWLGIPDGEDTEVFLYDGDSVQRLTENDFDEFSPDIDDDGNVVWSGRPDGSDFELYVFDGNDTMQLTDDEDNDILPKMSRNGHIAWSRGSEILLAIPCSIDNDHDNDGFQSDQCGGNDCDDTNAAVNPGATEICGNGIDDNCDGVIDPYPCTANAQAVTLGSSSLTGSGISNSLILLFIPVGTVIFLRMLRRRRL